MNLGVGIFISAAILLLYKFNAWRSGVGLPSSGSNKRAQSCSHESADVCPIDQMMLRATSCQSVDATGPITVGTAEMGLPPQLQGVFWLKDQGRLSALMSFATSRDGGEWSKLNLSSANGEHFGIRYPNDKVWSFHAARSTSSVVDLELKYKFKFEGEKGEAPTVASDIVAAQIIPEASILNKEVTLDQTRLLSFRMTLKRGAEKEYPNDVVEWKRDSIFLGLESAYDLVQVMDGTGKKNEVFSEWVSYCEDKRSTGFFDYGKIWYWTAEDHVVTAWDVVADWFAH